MSISHGLERVYCTAPRDRVFPNLVCIHGYGPSPENTWHHEETGKTWIDDAEFLGLLKGSCRVFSFLFNGDLAANLSAAAVAFHAHDLLECLEQALGNGNLGPVFFIAHSWGGIILKKAVQLCWTLPHFPKVKRMTAGLVFMGTPHISRDKSVIVKAIRATIAALGCQEQDIPESDIRHYAAAVCKINDLFTRAKPSVLKILSFWERLPTVLQGKPTSAGEEMIISKDCMHLELESNHDTLADCNHINLGRFPSVIDDRAKDFTRQLSEMIIRSLTEEDFSDLLVITKVPPSVKPSKDPTVPSSPPPSSGTATPNEERQEPNKEQPDVIQQINHYFKVWSMHNEEADAMKQKSSFLAALNGWSEENRGSRLFVFRGTCQWFTSDPKFQAWESEPSCGLLTYLGEPGQGKTHLASAISRYLQAKHPGDTTIAFFAIPGQRQPAIWEYFTHELLNSDPSWWSTVPSQYRDRGANSLPLDQSVYFEIWRAFRTANSGRRINLIVDGLEQCDTEPFEAFIAFVRKLRALNPVPRKTPTFESKGPVLVLVPTMVNAILTCRPTTCVRRARGVVTDSTIPISSTVDDISRYVAKRLAPRAGEHNPKLEVEARLMQQQIVDQAHGYWPYAKYAVDQLEQSSPPWPHCRFDSAHHMPVSLGKDLELRVTSYIRDIRPDRQAITLVGILISLGGRAEVRMLLDLLRGVFQEEELRNFDAEKLVNDNTYGLFAGTVNECVTFAHDSILYSIRTLVSEEQRSANMVFVCLNYLLMDRFCKRLQLLEAPFQAMDAFNAAHPAYKNAALMWPHCLRGAKDLGLQMMPLLRAFFSKDRANFWNWCTWCDRTMPDRPVGGSYNDPVEFLLIEHGCFSILSHLLAERPKIEPSMSQGSSIEHGAFEVSKEWPESVTCNGESPLAAAIRQGLPEAIHCVLQWKPNVNARSYFGRTALMTCFQRPLQHVPGAQSSTWRVEQLLKAGADPNICDIVGKTALHYACLRGDLPSVIMLLDCGASVNIADLSGVSPIEQAFVVGDVEIFRDLVRCGADVDAIWSSGDVPLAQCIRHDKLEMFITLIDYANVNAADRHGLTPLMVACSQPGQEQYIRLLLRRPHIDLDFVEGFGLPTVDGDLDNALSLAAIMRNSAAVELLLLAGADAGLLPGMMSTALYHAADNDDIGTMRLLLAHSSPVNVYCHQLSIQTPLAVAVHRRHEDAVRLLLENGADPNIETIYGKKSPLEIAAGDDTPQLAIVQALLEAPLPPSLHVLVKSRYSIVGDIAEAGNLELVRLILEHGLDLTYWLRNPESPSPLYTAAENGHTEICSLILQYEPGLLNAQSPEGFQFQTPLHAAAAEGKAGAVRLLLAEGAQPNKLSCHYEESALLNACYQDDYECVKLLIEATPDMINTRDIGGVVPLFAACSEGNPKIIKLLLEEGATITSRDMHGEACISRVFTDSEERSVEVILQLLLDHGLDLNAIQSASGLTTLGQAIVSGQARHVEWLLEHGADPMRCHQYTDQPSFWQNALQLALVDSEARTFDLLLEPRWGLLKHLTDVDSTGLLRWPIGIRYSQDVACRMSKLYHASAAYQAEIGEDILSKFIDQRDVWGRSMVDIALGSLAIRPEMRPTLRARIASWIQSLLEAEYSRAEHISLVERIANHLLADGDFDDEAKTLSSVVLSLPVVQWDEESMYVKAEGRDNCHECEEEIQETIFICRLCAVLRCEKCSNVRDGPALHNHDLVAVPLELHDGWKPEDVRGILMDVHDRLIGTTIHPDDVASEGMTDSAEHKISTTDEDRNGEINENTPSPNTSIPPLSQYTSLQTSLQLATLHAFNYLATPRPLFTPYLPLPCSTEALIAPWSDMIRQRRQFIDRDNLEMEGWAFRRFEELRYVNRGLTRGYADEEDVKMGLILKDVGLYLFGDEDLGDSEDEEPRLGSVVDDGRESQNGDPKERQRTRRGRRRRVSVSVMDD